MRVRADIAALINAGLDDGQIARRVNCHRATVNRTRNLMRRALAEPAALERLYAEALPTGRVTDYRPARMPTSPAQAAANRERLLAALRETPTHHTESEAA
ncbi:helix-turn-helix domain-containing protein [Streptomyces hygroscopicus]|uniref:helix-turn-helix domain-containing protein n=1 Tax=Streptomyces hygroscopicus TaxID=1912 RepID=UPI0037A7B7C6